MKVERINRGNWGKVKAFLDIKTTEGLVIKGFKIIDGTSGLFVSMPSEPYKDENGDTKYRNFVWVDNDIRNEFSELCLNAYHSQTEKVMDYHRQNNMESTPTMKVDTRNKSNDAPKHVADDAKRFEKYNPYAQKDSGMPE